MSASKVKTQVRHGTPMEQLLFNSPLERVNRIAASGHDDRLQKQCVTSHPHTPIWTMYAISDFIVRKSWQTDSDTMNSVIDFLGEQTAFKRFLDLYSQQTRKLIVFCGAGASKEAGLPDWDGLVKKVREELVQPIYRSEESKRKISKFDLEDDFWTKLSLAKEITGENYFTIIESILSSQANPPSFFRNIWNLRVSGLITMNLDGLAQKGFVERHSRLPHLYTGREAFHAKNAFIDDASPTIVELHGNIEKRSSWILTKEDYESLSGDPAYSQFLRNIFANSIVLIYGLSAGDASVTGQLRYLKETKTANGQYFLLKRAPATDADRELSVTLGIQPIYIPDKESWESGFGKFSQYVGSYKSKEPPPSIVLSATAGEDELPEVTELLSLTPDEVRRRLNSASQRFIGNEIGFSNFKDRYDLAINHAARVKIGTNNDHWLGHKLISERGSGNFGRVFQASDNKDGYVAIKIAHEAVRDNHVMLNSFRRGVSSMRYLSESDIRGIVRIVDASELPPSIVMDYVNGVNFEEAINQGYISELSGRLQAIRRICEIVLSCHTHEKSILHRDLRPQNIMIGGDFWEHIDLDEIKVLDFDLSWFEGATGQDYYMPATSALGYLAPEQLDANSKYSARSGLVDVYGLSMLLYFALAKQHPTAAASEREDWATRISEACAKVYSPNWKCLPARIARLIADGTNASQEERPLLPTFIERIKELEELSSGYFVNIADIILHEIFQRLFSSYHYGDVFRHENYSGVTVFAKPQYDRERFLFTFESLATEYTKRSNLGKYLSESLMKVRDIVKSIGEIDKDDTNIGMSRMKLTLRIPFPENFAELDRLTSTLERAITSMRIE